MRHQYLILAIATLIASCATSPREQAVAINIKAMEIIHELEPHPRSIYCGAIGYIRSNGDMDTNITIRTLVCSNEQIHCWAGGGLVADSECDSEYQETLDKVGKILPTLANL